MLSHKAVHLIQGINEQKASEGEKILMNQVHSIFCSSNALWIPCHNKEGINLASFLSENKANSYASLYSANLMRDASLNDRVELRILGDVGAKIRVMNFDTPDVHVPNFLSLFPFSLQFFDFSYSVVDESCHGCL
ncbi:hypothetical protein S245_058978 [Arachis hypogaea]